MLTPAVIVILDKMICEYTVLKLLLSLTEYYMTIEDLKRSHIDYF